MFVSSSIRLHQCDISISTVRFWKYFVLFRLVLDCQLLFGDSTDPRLLETGISDPLDNSQAASRSIGVDFRYTEQWAANSRENEEGQKVSTDQWGLL